MAESSRANENRVSGSEDANVFMTLDVSTAAADLVLPPLSSDSSGMSVAAPASPGVVTVGPVDTPLQGSVAAAASVSPGAGHPSSNDDDHVVLDFHRTRRMAVRVRVIRLAQGIRCSFRNIYLPQRLVSEMTFKLQWFDPRSDRFEAHDINFAGDRADIAVCQAAGVSFWMPPTELVIHPHPENPDYVDVDAQLYVDKHRIRQSARWRHYSAKNRCFWLVMDLGAAADGVHRIHHRVGPFVLGTSIARKIRKIRYDPVCWPAPTLDMYGCADAAGAVTASATEHPAILCAAPSPPRLPSLPQQPGSPLVFTPELEDWQTPLPAPPLPPEQLDLLWPDQMPMSPDISFPSPVAAQPLSPPHPDQFAGLALTEDALLAAAAAAAAGVDGAFVPSNAGCEPEPDVWKVLSMLSSDGLGLHESEMQDPNLL